MPVVAHSVQVVVTVGLLAATALLALYCDYLRLRWSRQTAGAKAVAQKVAAPVSSRPTAHGNGRGSRLAAALKQGRRPLSPGARAVIARSARVGAPELPQGWQDSGAVAHLLRSDAKVSGQVVLVGVTYHGDAGSQARASARAALGGLLRPEEFAAPLPGGNSW